MPFPFIPLLTPLAISVAGWMGFRNTDKTTSTSKEIAEQQQANQLKLAALNIQAQRDLEENRQYFQMNMEMSRQQFQERMAYLGFKQQLTLREFDQQFQLRLRELDHQQQREVEEFRAKVSVAINQKNLDFQAWKFEQEMTLQQEMAQFNRETQLAIATYQRETALQQPEINKIYENWPLKLLPTQILNSHPNHLRIFISPPELDYDRFTNLTDPKSHSFPRVESFLGTRLLKLLNQHYPRNDGLRPTQLLDEAWDSKRFAGSSSIVALADRLESEPLVVLETRVTLNKYLSLRVAYKGVGQRNYFYDEVIPRFEYGNILLASAKARIGKNVPVDTQKIQVTPDDWEVLYEMLEVAHCIVAAWIADVHHLIYYNASPLLPQLLPGVVKELPSFLLTDTNSVLIPLMQEVIKGYQAVFQQLEKTERRYQVPELFLDLAHGVMNLEDKSLSKKLADESMQSWLRLRGIPNKMDSLSKVATKNDLSFLRQVLEIYQSIGNIEMSIKLDKLIVQILSRELAVLKTLFQDRPEVLKMLDLRELDLRNLTDERMVEEQRKRQLFPEPVNLYVTGRTVAGKTSLINSLLNCQVMKSNSFQDCTDFIGYFKLAGNLACFDLPGIGSNINYENINRVALLMEQLPGNKFSKSPVNPLKLSDQLLVKDFSKCTNPNISPEAERMTVEHWQSDVQQAHVAPDVVLYVLAPHMQFIDPDRQYLGSLLETWKVKTDRCIIIPVLNIFRKEDGTVLPAPNQIEYACQEISEIYRSVYSSEELPQINPVVQINSKSGGGIARITELICKILPQEKVGNLGQVLQVELKQFAEKELSRRYRQTLVSIASRLATYTVDTQLGNQNLLQEAYAAVCNYGLMVFMPQEIFTKAEKEELLGNIVTRAKISSMEFIERVESTITEKKQTIVIPRFKIEVIGGRETIVCFEEKKEIVTEVVVGQCEKVVGKRAKQGGYSVVEDLLAIGLGLEMANPSQDLRKNFSAVVENGRKQVQAKLVRYKDQINQLAESGNPGKAEQEIIGILKRVLES